MQATHVPNPTGTDGTVRQPTTPTAPTYGIMEVEAAEDHTGKEGYCVDLDANSKATLVNSVSDLPFGVIVTGAAQGSNDTVALCYGGHAGTVSVRLSATPGTVKIGTILQTTSNGTLKADAGAGSRILAAQAVSAGGANALITVVLFTPVAL